MEREFELFFKANERRIHYQIQRLGIRGPLYEEFYAEGIFALWQAYRTYDESKGDIGTYLNYQIRFRLLDLIRNSKRKETLMKEAALEQVRLMDDGNRHGTMGARLINRQGIVIENDAFWQEVKKHLTIKQWKWVHYFIIADLTVQEIVELEGASAEAVKSWGYQARKKLHNPRIMKKLQALM